MAPFVAVYGSIRVPKTWMPGTKLGMTPKESSRLRRRAAERVISQRTIC
jgi:hypothetical protein